MRKFPTNRPKTEQPFSRRKHHNARLSVQIGFREDSVSKGVVLSVSASVLFAVMYYFTSLLTPLSGLEIFGWRMLLTVPCMTVFMIVSGEWRRVWELLQVLAAKPRLIAGVVLSSALLGVQLWLFMWAPLNGRSLDVSVGYFLLPLTMVLTGRLVWGEQLSYLQKIAVFFAGLGVLNELYQAGGFSWATLVVIIGYPLYFIVRKYLKTDNLGGLSAGYGADAAGGLVVRAKRRARFCGHGCAPKALRIDSHAGSDQRLCIGERTSLPADYCRSACSGCSAMSSRCSCCS